MIPLLVVVDLAANFCARYLGPRAVIKSQSRRAISVKTAQEAKKLIKSAVYISVLPELNSVQGGPVWTREGVARF